MFNEAMLANFRIEFILRSMEINVESVCRRERKRKENDKRATFIYFWRHVTFASIF